MTTPPVQRHYSLDQIDAMRKAIELGLIRFNVPFNAEEKLNEREQVLRTAMIAGVDPEEFIAAEEAKYQAMVDWMKECRKQQLVGMREIVPQGSILPIASPISEPVRLSWMQRFFGMLERFK
jgi:hypothetical protein